MQRPEKDTAPAVPDKAETGWGWSAWADEYTLPAAAGGNLLQGGPAAAGSEASSTTCLAPLTPPHSWRCLACGIDSLEVGLAIQWNSLWEQTTTRLNEAKSRASGTEGVFSHDLRYLIHPTGKPPSYAWHLEWPEYHLFLGKSREPQRQTPNGLVKAKAKALWSLGINGIMQRVTVEIERLGGELLGTKPSRCDLAADFLIPDDLTLEFLSSHCVPQHVKQSQYLDGKRLETFYHGAKKSTIQLRIYDKSREIAQRGDKLWFLQVWQHAQLEHVWRVEFQVRRAPLREFAIHTLEDLQQQLGGLWQYLTEWVSFRVPGDSNTTRRPLHPWWEAVRQLADQFGPSVMLRRNFEGEPADSHWYSSHIAGCLAGFAACEGLTDIDDAFALMIARVSNYWRTRNWAEVVAAKHVRLGEVSPLARPNDLSQDGIASL